VIDSNKLRKLRMLAGLSQRQLCKLAGIGPLGVKRIEDGADASRLPLHVVGRIAAALGVQIADLIDNPARGAALPDVTTSAASTTDVGLDLNQARLLRRLHRGENIQHSLTRADRELTLPNLIRSGVVVLHAGQPSLSALVKLDIAFDVEDEAINFQ